MVFIASIIHSEATETGIILLIEQEVAVIFENKHKSSDFATMERLLKNLQNGSSSNHLWVKYFSQFSFDSELCFETAAL